MKKLLICIITLILVFSLSSCISIKKKLRIIGNTEDIIAIDVYYIDVTNEKIVTKTIDEYEPVYSVPTDELVAFANKMETIIYKKKLHHCSRRLQRSVCTGLYRLHKVF